MDYTYFTFDGVSSSRYNLVVQNQGEDLIFPSQPGFENQIIAPIYQGATYLAGVNKTARTFNLNCWVDSITTDLVREMLNWISVNKISTLTFDYNPNFSYRVKVNSLSDFKHFAVNLDGTSNYEFTLSFITIGSPASQSVLTYNLTASIFDTAVTGPNVDNGAPIGFRDPTYSNIFKFLNYYSEAIPLRLSISTAQGFDVKLNGTTYYDYSLSTGLLTDFSIDTEYGFCKIGSELAESVSGVTANTNIGLMKIPSGESEAFISTISYWEPGTQVIQIANSPSVISYTLDEAIAGNLYVIVQDGTFGESSTPGEPTSDALIIWGADENIELMAVNKAADDGLCNSWDTWYALPYSSQDIAIKKLTFSGTTAYVEFILDQPLNSWMVGKTFAIYYVTTVNSTPPNFYNTLNGVVTQVVLNADNSGIMGIRYTLPSTPTGDTTVTYWGKISGNKATREYYINWAIANS